MISKESNIAPEFYKLDELCIEKYRKQINKYGHSWQNMTIKMLWERYKEEEKEFLEAMAEETNYPHIHMKEEIIDMIVVLKMLYVQCW